MDNTVRTLNIDNTDYKFPQGFPIMAGYSSYGSTKVDLTQNFSLPFATQYFGFSDTFPKYASTITADEAKTEIKKYRPLLFKWDWYDTESSGSEHIITTELYPVDGSLNQFRDEVPITVNRNGISTTYIGCINISLLDNTFTYTYIRTIYSTDELNNLSDVSINNPELGQILVYDPNTDTWINDYPEYNIGVSRYMDNTRSINANSYYDFTINTITDATFNNYPVIDIEQLPNFNPNIIPMYIRREHSNSLPDLNVPGYIYHFRLYNFTSSTQVTGDYLDIVIKEYARGSAI